MPTARSWPDGQLIVPENETLAYIRRQPTRKVGGIGKATEKILASINITTVEDIWERRVVLRALCEALTWYERFDFFLSVAMGLDYELSSGIGPSRGLPPSPGDIAAGEALKAPPRRAIGVERTFPPTSNLNILYHRLNLVCRSLAADFEHERANASIGGIGVRPGRCITLKIKFASFNAITRSHRQSKYLSTQEQFYEQAKRLLDIEWKKLGGFRVRLLGVRLSEFTPEGQLRLDEMQTLHANNAVSDAKATQLMACLGANRTGNADDESNWSDYGDCDFHCEHDDCDCDCDCESDLEEDFIARKISAFRDGRVDNPDVEQRSKDSAQRKAFAELCKPTPPAERRIQPDVGSNASSCSNDDGIVRFESTDPGFSLDNLMFVHQKK